MFKFFIEINGKILLWCKYKLFTCETNHTAMDGGVSHKRA